MKAPLQLPQDAEARRLIAPQGALRVGLYQGSPSSYMPSPDSGEARGVGYLLGHCLARALGIEFTPCIFKSNAEVLAAVKSAGVDLVFTNATEERRKFIDFGPVLLNVGKSVLATGQSPLKDMQSLHAGRYTIGYSKGSTTATEFSSIFPQADMAPVESLDRAAAMLLEGTLQGFATNVAILATLAARVPGSTIFSEFWGAERYALGTPLGRHGADAVLSAFSARAKESGFLEDCIARSGFAGASTAA
jgi:polar amino acid transport system substrate-binding protein